MEKRQIRDYRTTSFPVEDDDSLDDVSYSGLRLLPHFALRKLINDAMDLSENNNGQDIAVNLLSHTSGSYQICLYCQFRDSCIRATREEDEG